MPEQISEYLLPKKQVARSFSLAARGYDKASQLQEIVAERLLERLELIKIEPGLVLDLGSGPGKSSARLAKYYRKARVLEADISHAMLLRSSKEAPRFFSRRQRICTDAERIGIRSASAGLVFSNLMLQWCNNLDHAISEVRRILQKNGLFIFSTFGPDTLVELRKSWQAVDQDTHVNAFVDMHDIGDALIRAGMENPVMETEKMIVEYDNAFELMRDLKQLGAHNLNSGRRRSLTGKKRLQRMMTEYETWRVAGKLPATYEVIYGHAWLPLETRAFRVDEQTLAYPVSALKPGRKKG